MSAEVALEDSIIRGSEMLDISGVQQRKVNERNPMTKIETLQAEIAAMDTQLHEIDAQERNGDQGVSDVALRAHRGDSDSEKQIRTWSQHKHDLGVRRFSLESAKRAVEAELVEARQALAQAQEQARAEEAQAIIKTFRTRGKTIDAALKTLVANLGAVERELQQLAKLTPSRVDRELVRVSVDLALRTILANIPFLDIQRVPPGQRHSFDEIIHRWADHREAWVSEVLNTPFSPRTPRPPPRPKPFEPTPATMPTRRAASIHDGPAPLKERNIAGHYQPSNPQGCR
jgi:hypothetical protein